MGGIDKRLLVTGCGRSGTKYTAELLQKLEADVAAWRAPILPLAFLDPLTFAINDRGSIEESLDARLFDRRFAEGGKP